MTTPIIKPWVFITLALLAATIGLSSSVVTAEFFIVGLQNTDADTTTQTAQEQVASRFVQQRETDANNLRKAQQLQAQASAQVLELSRSTARAIQACLTAEGLIERSGQGYRLAEAGQVVLW